MLSECPNKTASPRGVHKKDLDAVFGTPILVFTGAFVLVLNEMVLVLDVVSASTSTANAEYEYEYEKSQNQNSAISELTLQIRKGAIPVC